MIRPSPTARRLLWMAVCVLQLVGGCAVISSSPEGHGIRDHGVAARILRPAELRRRIIEEEQRNEDPEVLSLLRSAYSLKLGDYSSALKHIGKVNPRGRWRHPALWLAGESLYRLGNLGQALKILVTLTNEASDDLDGHRCLAAVYFDMGAMTHAEAELTHVMRLAPDDYRPHHLLGRMQLDFEKYHAALNSFRRAEDLYNGDNASNLQSIRRGVAASLLGERDFNGVLARFPANEFDPFISTYRAQALWNLGRTPEARHVLDRVLTESTDFVDALLLSARIDADGGALIPAAESLRKILKMQPHHVEARHQLAMVQRQSGDLDASVETVRQRETSQKLMNRLVELNEQVIDAPSDLEIRKELAEVCRRLGKHALASMWERTAEGLRQYQEN